MDGSGNRAAAQTVIRGRGIIVDAGLHIDGAVDRTPHRSFRMPFSNVVS
jgi:hypothetical protein